jgi:hypothetical protein
VVVASLSLLIEPAAAQPPTATVTTSPDPYAAAAHPQPAQPGPGGTARPDPNGSPVGPDAAPPAAATTDHDAFPLEPAPAAPVTRTHTNAGGPLVAYTGHFSPPQLTDMTPGSAMLTAAFGVAGAIAEMGTGREIVMGYHIADPSGDMAREIATAYGAAHGAEVADDPVAEGGEGLLRTKPETLAKLAGGAQYIVEVESPGMTLMYFSFDWKHRDLMFLSTVRIIDVPTAKVIAHARCFLRAQQSPDLLTHDQLLEDNAAALKRLIVSKSEACVAKMKSDLKL